MTSFADMSNGQRHEYLTNVRAGYAHLIAKAVVECRAPSPNDVMEWRTVHNMLTTGSYIRPVK